MSILLPDTSLELYGAPCAVLDFETTWSGDEVPGTYAGRWHEVSQHPIEASVLHGRVGIDGFEVVVDQRYRPTHPVHPESTAVHGITDTDLVDCDSFDAGALDQILDAISGRILVAYNLPFEWMVLCDACERHGFDPIPFAGLDPLILARVLEPKGYSCALQRVARRHGRILWAHGAKADTEATFWYLNSALRSLHFRELWEPQRLANFGATWSAQVVEAIAWERLADARHMSREKSLVLYWTDLMGDSRE